MEQQFMGQECCSGYSAPIRPRFSYRADRRGSSYQSNAQPDLNQAVGTETIISTLQQAHLNTQQAAEQVGLIL